MIIAAAACAAAGISYIFNDDEQSTKTKQETVTASSTIVDQQGILKYVIYPRYSFPNRLLINEEQKAMMMKMCKSNQFEVPMENRKRLNHFEQDFSVVFYWSMPLKARLLQTPTKSSVMMENLNPFQHHSMKISIGTQNESDAHLSSEIALSNSNDTLDSLSSNPIGILKKKRFDCNGSGNDEKRFCFDRGFNDENQMRNMILQNVNLCVDNLSKILSESCSNTEQQLTTLETQSLIQPISQNSHANFLQSEDDRKYNRERLFDGMILHRGEQFGVALGEPMMRKSTERGSSHSINELDRLFSKTNCFLMQQDRIDSIEDLIRLYFREGEERFTDLMSNRFQVHPYITAQVNFVLHQWSKQLEHH